MYSKSVVVLGLSALAMAQQANVISQIGDGQIQASQATGGQGGGASAPPSAPASSAPPAGG